jgi:DNA-binding transcriptional ArsR family regulator
LNATSRQHRSSTGSAPQARAQAQAPVFAALGDKTRLALVAKLCAGPARSISELAADFALTRQAITKHLKVLERAGIVRSRRRGRESRFEFDPRPIGQLKAYLELVSEHWDQALSRLKALVDG